MFSSVENFYVFLKRIVFQKNIIVTRASNKQRSHEDVFRIKIIFFLLDIPMLMNINEFLLNTRSYTNRHRRMHGSERASLLARLSYLRMRPSARTRRETAAFQRKEAWSRTGNVLKYASSSRKITPFFGKKRDSHTDVVIFSLRARESSLYISITLRAFRWTIVSGWDEKNFFQLTRISM